MNTNTDYLTPVLQVDNELKLSENIFFQHVACRSGSVTNIFTTENTLIFVQEGSIGLSHGSSPYCVSEDKMVLVRKNIVLRARCNEVTDLIAFVLKKDVVSEFAKLVKLNFRQHSGRENLVHEKKVSNYLDAYIASLRPYSSNGVNIPSNVARLKLLELLFCLYENNHPLIEEIMNVREQFHPDVTQVVEENITNALSLDQLARLAGRSVSSFRRDFLAIYNTPPSQWIRQRKLQKAHELILNTSMTVTSICYILGFHSIAHFSRLFKSQFGYSPTSARLQASIGDHELKEISA